MVSRFSNLCSKLNIGKARRNLRPVNRLAGFGVAWLVLCGSLAIHVADEALTD